MENSSKENHVKSTSIVKPSAIDIRDYKPSKTSLELKTPSVTVNLLSETFNTDINQQTKDSQLQKSANDIEGSNLYSYSVRNKYPKVEAFSVSKTPLTIQALSTRGTSFKPNISKSPSSRVLPKPNTEKRLNTMGSPTAQSLCSSPRAFKGQTEAVKVPVFPSKANSLTDKNLKRSASEHKIMPVSATSARSENVNKFPSEQQNRPIIPRPNRKPQTAQKKNVNNSIEKPLKNSMKTNEVVLTEKNETPKKPQGLSTNSPRINSAQSYSQKLKGDIAPPIDPQLKTPKGGASSMRTVKSLTSLPSKIPGENNKNIAGYNKSGGKPNNTALKEIFLNCKSETDLDREIRNRTEISSPASMMKRDRTSLSKLNFEQEKNVSNFHEDLHAVKTTYFQPIEDFKLNEFIQNVKNSHHNSAKSQCKVHREADIENNKNIKQPLSVTSFNAVLPSPATLSERNNNTSKSVVTEKHIEEKALKPKYNNSNHNENINIDTKIVKVEIHPAKEKMQRSNSKDQILNRKQGKFYESKRESQQKENLLKSARLRPGENLYSANESLSVSKNSRTSLIARVHGDSKLSPKGAIVSHDMDTNTYSKLDQLLKNFKGDKIEMTTDRENKETRDMNEGLFANNCGDDEEAPMALSNLKKSLAKILIAKNEN